MTFVKFLRTAFLTEQLWLLSMPIVRYLGKTCVYIFSWLYHLDRLLGDGLYPHARLCLLPLHFRVLPETGEVNCKLLLPLLQFLNN